MTVSFIHPTAICDTKNIGKGTKIWAFAHILSNVKIGEDCNICDHVFIESGAILGSRVTIKNGVQIWSGVTIEDDVFVGPNVTFTNDLYPRSKNSNFELQSTLLKSGASIGGGCTILPSVTIGKKAMIGAGTVVTKDVPDYAVIVGNPGRILKYIDPKNI